MLGKPALLLTIVFIASSFALGQTVYTPEKGSPERAAIVNTLRLPVEKDLKQKIVFVPDNFNVMGNWAFIGGAPQASGGGVPDYTKTAYAGAVKEGFFDNNFFALLKKTGGKWKIVKYQLGCTDVCYAGWWRIYRAPKAVFPYTE